MKSYFSTAPFGRYDLSRESWKPAAMGDISPMTQYDFSIISDVLGDLGIKESDVTNLLSKVPAQMTPDFRKRLDDCRDMGVTSTDGAKCLLALYNDMQKASKTPVAVVPPPASAFPVVPVLVAGAAAVGLIWFFTREQKK